MDPEHLQRRCPKLGHGVAFKYCLTCDASQSACHKILDCWWERFDVVTYCRRHLPPKTFEGLQKSDPKPKINTILDLIEQARKKSGA